MKFFLFFITTFFLATFCYAGEAMDAKEKPAQEKPSHPYPGDVATPAAMLSVGGIAALAFATNPWIVAAVILGLSLLVGILIILILSSQKGLNVLEGILLALAVLILVAFWLAVVAALVIGLAYLIGLIFGIAASPVLAGLLIAGIGAVWFLIMIVRYSILKKRYKKKMKKENPDFERA